jgi:hypothetical protein
MSCNQRYCRAVNEILLLSGEVSGQCHVIFRVIASWWIPSAWIGEAGTLSYLSDRVLHLQKPRPGHCLVSSIPFSARNRPLTNITYFARVRKISVWSCV